MAITTYDELKASIANWLNRDDLTAVIPDFISLAEAGMNKSIRHWRMENRATAELDSQYEALPANFVAPISLSITSPDYTQLIPAGHSEANLRRQQTGNTSGRPAYYLLTQGELEFFPTPDGSYTLEMVYYEKPAPLSDATASNWVLEYFPDVYLYGALVHAAPYLVDDARLNTWNALYQNALQQVLDDEQKAKFGGSALRMKIRSY